MMPTPNASMQELSQKDDYFEDNLCYIVRTVPPPPQSPKKRKKRNESNNRWHELVESI